MPATVHHPSRFVTVWAGLEAQVAAGQLPGYVTAVRFRGEVEVHAGGCRGRRDRAPMDAGSLFRLASVSTPYAGALTLVLAQDGVLDLDDAVGRWLPELAEPRVLATAGGPLSDTAPASRPITVRHLLTSTPGFGGLRDGSPLDVAIGERGLAPGGLAPRLTADEYLARLGELPLAAQPGERWLHHLSTEVLSVLLARASGRPLSQLLAERVTGPLGLTSTAFQAVEPARLTTACLPGAHGLELLDPADGVAARPPQFEGLAAGLVASAPDVLAFYCALADGGGPVLAPGSVAALTSDALTADQRAGAARFLGAGRSWGLQTGVQVEPGEPWARPGRWGRDGGTGTTAWADPGADLVAVLLTQRGRSPGEDLLDRFWQALDRCV